MDSPLKKIYFASDAHLGARFHTDAQAIERTLVRWIDSIKADAAAVYFLGDMFDYWYEYRYVVPKGYVRFLGKLAELTDAGVEVHLFTGNHDVWMFDYLPEATGAIVHRDVLTVDLLGKRFLLGHGDEVGRRRLALRFLRGMFRNKVCQWLYGGVHPRWTFGFALGWSLSSRRGGLESEESKDCLVAFAREYAEAHPEVDFLIFGHCHVMLDMPLAGGSRLLIAGDWMRLFSYVEWDGEKLSLLQFNND